MLVISERNVQKALTSALIHFRTGGATLRPSRNGPMLEMDQPVTTVYRNPRERVLFDPVRDANPFLHFFESLWMLAGCNDVGFLTLFTKNMANFSDDGKTLHGAYGHRWRNHFKRDQIDDLVLHLREDPMSRRAVTQMWDPNVDFPPRSKDHPCNTQIMWRLRDGALDMTVLNRSNDAIWGCYGANAVHFSFLQEYVACSLGVQVGVYRQVSNSLHIYPDIPVAAKMLEAGGDSVDYYKHGIQPGPMLISPSEEPWSFDNDLARFMKKPDGDWEPQTAFFGRVALPLWRAHQFYRERGIDDALLAMDHCAAEDWRFAGVDWLERRKEARNK